MDEATLTKKVGTIDNDNETTNWIEYYDKDLLVHRSVHVALKQGLMSQAFAQPIG